MYRVMLGVLVVVAIVALPQMLLAQEGEKPEFNPKEIFKKVKEADKDKDGKLSKEEVDENFRPHFDKVDTDKSGYLEAPEIRRAVRGMMIFMRLKKADKDGDNRLSKEEAPERMKARFDGIDKNSDGYLDLEELKPVIERIVKQMDARGGPRKGKKPQGAKKPGKGRPHAEMFRKLKEADKDNDGKWSKEEAPGHMKENFGKLDANSDGFVDKGELKKAIQAHMKEAGKKAHGDKCGCPKCKAGGKKAHGDKCGCPKCKGKKAHGDKCGCPKCKDGGKKGHDHKAHGKKGHDHKGHDHKGHDHKGHEHKGHHGHGDKDKGHKGHAEFFKRLKEADKNNDGKLSKEEAPGPLKEHFEKIDANDDGQIDKAELKAAFKARMEQHRKRQAEGSEKK